MAKWRDTKKEAEETEVLKKTQDELNKPKSKRYAALRSLFGDDVVDQWVQQYSDEDEMPDDGRSVFDDEEDDDEEGD